LGRRYALGFALATINLLIYLDRTQAITTESSFKANQQLWRPLTQMACGIYLWPNIYRLPSDYTYPLYLQIISDTIQSPELGIELGNSGIFNYFEILSMNKKNPDSFEFVNEHTDGSHS
jgi:hypothetical protein